MRDLLSSMIRNSRKHALKGIDIQPSQKRFYQLVYIRPCSVVKEKC